MGRKPGTMWTNSPLRMEVKELMQPRGMVFHLWSRGRRNFSRLSGSLSITMKRRSEKIGSGEKGKKSRKNLEPRRKTSRAPAQGRKIMVILPKRKERKTQKRQSKEERSGYELIRETEVRQERERR